MLKEPRYLCTTLCIHTLEQVYSYKMFFILICLVYLFLQDRYFQYFTAHIAMYDCVKLIIFTCQRNALMLSDVFHYYWNMCEIQCHGSIMSFFLWLYFTDRSMCMVVRIFNEKWSLCSLSLAWRCMVTFYSCLMLVKVNSACVHYILWLILVVVRRLHVTL